MSIWMRGPGGKLAGLTIGIVLLLACVTANICFGLQPFTLKQLWLAYSRFNGSNEHLIITSARVPRALIAAGVGASLAVAGAVMQTLTRNPLASPSVFGINSGSALFIVVALVVFGSDLTMGTMIWIAFAGAAASALFVYSLGLQRGDGFSPLKLTLAGTAVAAFSSSVTSGLILINKQSLDEALLWMIGSVSGRQLAHLLTVAPYMAAGLIVALLLSGALNVMALGEEIAKGLGQRLTLMRALATLSVILLAGSAVSVAGPIAFVGLIVPHLCRYVAGNDHRWLLPYCALIGAMLLVTADLASRLIIMPKEVPVGVATALLGVPFLIHVARRRQHA
ncbi:iron ABC transporter permease [Paenibacillus sp. MZ04-78.2]|uniref:FecCD family ABC transporter permease n=1 Tax=Paenibacillus sp. MZ04-78.2 TaxID=2962034 RepID=UPI0020B822DB|nr:iron ABC transporter permease [Paenibacillus sp. MZ04-78.2]MCP3776451.1 iron ABC transporter permease [Paenibacillus sp. MZ04-78.2]